MSLASQDVVKWPFLLLLWWPCPAGAAAAEPFLEVRDMPHYLADQLEGVYTQWSRWINGPVYRRAEPSYRLNPNVPVFLGAFCTHEFGGMPTEWCFAQCEEEHMATSPGLLLPCGAPGPDSTSCPPPAPSAPSPPAGPGGTPSPQPRPVICAVLGHARRWHEAGWAVGTAPPAGQWWRLRGEGDGGWQDAEASMAAPSLFPRGLTLRPGARPALCLGAEQGQLRAGSRLIFWDCGAPAYRHEQFSHTYDAHHGSLLLRSSFEPYLCATVDALKDGQAVRLDKCSVEAGVGQPVSFERPQDDTLRVPGGLCLATGNDRPELGAELRLQQCSTRPPTPNRAAEAPAAAPPTAGATAALPAPVPAPVPEPAEDMAAVAVLAAMRAMQQGIEAKFDAKIERLEREVAALKQQGAARGLAAESDRGSEGTTPEPVAEVNISEPACKATRKEQVTGSLPSGWLEGLDASSGLKYFWPESNPNATTWSRPRAASAAA
eukprot:CAMPEP_0168409252 /NCGR_PEP_ID=MMETSP0228-20121227/27088_1 /TAXON_ID=133427 /ORGANISM="Protoceratium reticulatum, Strain CCCM 535 (=CCMP 1889)" /LENGTH=489 /DNA_ID=CAMNT_0008422959 /DNA_START=16 /DNA_END=1486 /DNA_ORIENTATION=+